MEADKPFNMTVTEHELEAFKDSCQGIIGVEFVRHDADENNAYINYSYPHNLYYLGYVFKTSLEIQQNKQLRKELQKQ